MALPFWLNTLYPLTDTCCRPHPYDATVTPGNPDDTLIIINLDQNAHFVCNPLDVTAAASGALPVAYHQGALMKISSTRVVLDEELCLSATNLPETREQIYTILENALGDAVLR